MYTYLFFGLELPFRLRGDLEAVVQHSCLIKAQVYNRTRHRAKTAVFWKHALRFGPSRAVLEGDLFILGLLWFGSVSGIQYSGCGIQDPGMRTLQQQNSRGSAD